MCVATLLKHTTSCYFPDLIAHDRRISFEHTEERKCAVNLGNSHDAKQNPIYAVSESLLTLFMA